MPAIRASVADLYTVPPDLAVLLVSRPCWGRANLYDEPPATRAHKAIPERILTWVWREGSAAVDCPDCGMRMFQPPDAAAECVSPYCTGQDVA